MVFFHSTFACSINQLKIKTMFTAENLKKGVFTLVVVMVALAAHQRFIAPMLAPPKKA